MRPVTPVQQPLIAALSGPAPEGEVNPALERILDAALTQFEEVGIRRSSVADIARRAGVDRVTVYRRVGSKDDVIEAVIAREAGRLSAAVMAATEDRPTIDERIAVAFTTAIQEVRTNALYHRILALEADTVLPGLTTHGTPLLAVGVAAGIGLIEQAQEDGLIGPVADPQAVAEIFVRIVHSIVLTPRAGLALETDAELAEFARRHLAPIVTGRD